MINEITKIDLIHKDKIYRYDFNLLNVEQAELAREAGNFKANQLESEPENFNQIRKSRGAEFLFIIASYLLLEVQNGVVQEFNVDIAESEIESFIKKLPISEIEKLRLIVTDFFSKSGNTEIASKLLTNEKKLGIMQIFTMLTQMNNKKD